MKTIVSFFPQEAHSAFSSKEKEKHTHPKDEGRGVFHQGGSRGGEEWNWGRKGPVCQICSATAENLMWNLSIDNGGYEGRNNILKATHKELPWWFLIQSWVR